MSITRRQFMVGCSGAIAAMAGSRISNLVFDDPQSSVAEAASSNDIMVIVFLRGGCDGLSLVAPYDDAIYVQERGSELRMQNPLNLNVNNTAFGATSSFGLHPNASGLNELYQDGKLAIIHACGLDDDTRSHFDAMDYMERGTPGNKSTSSGWITRHLQSINLGGTIPTIAAGSSAPTSLLAASDAVALTSPDSYSLSGGWRYKSAMLETLERCYTGSSLIEGAGRRTIEAINTLQSTPDYTPTTTYPSGSFGDTLQTVAQMIKLDVGLRIATVDLGGWDHHENQGVNGGTFASLAGILSNGLHAFYNDLPNYTSRLNVIVMSEFGRRLGKNASYGTDHGHGNMMLALGGQVKGGKMYGKWPGLEDLDQNQDLKITTDYRQVLSELLVRRMANPKLGEVFPSYQDYTPLNIFNGTDLPIDYIYQVRLPSVVR